MNDRKLQLHRVNHKLKHGVLLYRQSGVMWENLRVNGIQECEDTNPPLGFFKALSEGDVVYVRGHGFCLLSLAAGSSCPSFCTNVNAVIMRSLSEGEQGRAPLSCASWFTVVLDNRSMNDWIGNIFFGEVKLSNWRESPALTSGGREPEMGQCFL